MGALVLVLGIIGFLVLFAYLKFPPAYAKKNLVSAFNMMVMAVCALLCLTWILNIRTTMMGGVNDQWWEPIAIAGALAIESVFLLICFILRNFWVFKPPRHPGQRGWF